MVARREPYGGGIENHSTLYQRDFDVRPSSYNLANRDTLSLYKDLSLPSRSTPSEYSKDYTTEYNAGFGGRPESVYSGHAPVSFASQELKYQNNVIAANAGVNASYLPATYSVAKHRSLGKQTSAHHPDVKLNWKRRPAGPTELANRRDIPLMGKDTFVSFKSRDVQAM
jgi:hypothetical protein